MNLYRISQTVNDEYDNFDSAVVCAESEESARNIHPAMQNKYRHFKSDWCEPSDVK